MIKNKIYKVNRKDLEKYKKQIDKDFEDFDKCIQDDEKRKRFIRLEKAWILNITHYVYGDSKYFKHKDRIGLRKELISYLNMKKKKDNKNLLWKENVKKQGLKPKKSKNN